MGGVRVGWVGRWACTANLLLLLLLLLSSTCAKNETTAPFLMFLAHYSRYWQWTINPGDMPCYRRMAWCFYHRMLVLGMGRFPISDISWVKAEDAVLNQAQGATHLREMGLPELIISHRRPCYAGQCHVCQYILK